jgi:hypothetical protein
MTRAAAAPARVPHAVVTSDYSEKWPVTNAGPESLHSRKEGSR